MFSFDVSELSVHISYEHMHFPISLQIKIKKQTFIVYYHQITAQYDVRFARVQRNDIIGIDVLCRHIYFVIGHNY